ncbi:hypothetical protein PYW08_016025 [Mythimna loreyi]|uniref:Uncharacterized protein n=1 Tax=Mythimna loreyi TaxID=667449 RepID=A0ACC2QSN9_9NEOP|nr:hypothetical protein PYW08_016025 [Mythimna loreyi]
MEFTENVYKRKKKYVSAVWNYFLRSSDKHHARYLEISEFVKDLKRKEISEVWKYFLKNEDKSFAECTLCDEEFKYNVDITELKKHLESKHKITLDTIKKVFFVEVEVGEGEEVEEKDNMEELKKAKPLRMRKNASSVWKYFVKSKDKTFGMCVICRNQSGSEAIVKYKRNYRSSVWEMFIRSKDKLTAKCKICGKRMKVNGTSALRRHLEAKHDNLEATEITYLVDVDEIDSEYEGLMYTKWTGNSIVWRYFLRSEDATKAYAKCTICEKVLKCEFGSTSALKKHLSAIHCIK